MFSAQLEVGFRARQTSDAVCGDASQSVSIIAHSDGEMLSLSIPVYYKCSVDPSTTAVVNFKFRGKLGSYATPQGLQVASCRRPKQRQ